MFSSRNQTASALTEGWILKKAFQKYPAVCPGLDPLVADNNPAGVVLRTDQSPETLFELQDRPGERIVVKRVPSISFYVLCPRQCDRLGGDFEGSTPSQKESRPKITAFALRLIIPSIRLFGISPCIIG